MVREAIVAFKPDFVLIDGIRDLGNDFNNVEESTKIINEILALSSEYRCAIMNVIHQNKGKDDTPRGHLGTELMNKCSDGYYVARPVGAPVTVSQKISRNAQISDWHFYINDEGKPESASAPLTQVDLKKNEIKENFKQIFPLYDKL